MSQVKWVPVGGYDTVEGEHFKVPMVPLSTLAEVVEGLRKIQHAVDSDESWAGVGIMADIISRDLLTQLEAHRP